MKIELWQDEAFQVGSETLGINDMVEKMNDQLFTVLGSELRRNDTNILPFLDIAALSRDVSEWTVKGGVHMDPVWYKHVIAYILQTICNSNKI